MDGHDSLKGAVDALKSRLKDLACPMCRGGSFSIGEMTLTPDPPSFPMRLVVMICAGCGFTAMHDRETLAA